MSTRQERVKELLKIEISDIILRNMRDPRIGFVTITGADVSKDLKYARVYFSVMGDDTQKQESTQVLQKAAGFIRSEFAHRVSMKVIPQITFRMDTSVDHGSRIFELLQQVKNDEKK